MATLAEDVARDEATDEVTDEATDETTDEATDEVGAALALESAASESAPASTAASIWTFAFAMWSGTDGPSCGPGTGTGLDEIDEGSTRCGRCTRGA